MAEKHLDPLWIEHGYGTRFQGFQNLMRHRIRDVLLVSSLYDLYLFEEDGRFDELISNEYQSLNLSHSPELTRVSSGKEAIALAKEERRFDLILTTLHVEDMTAVRLAQLAREAGRRDPDRSAGIRQQGAQRPQSAQLHGRIRPRLCLAGRFPADCQHHQTSRRPDECRPRHAAGRRPVDTFHRRQYPLLLDASAHSVHGASQPVPAADIRRHQPLAQIPQNGGAAQDSALPDLRGSLALFRDLQGTHPGHHLRHRLPARRASPITARESGSRKPCGAKIPNCPSCCSP